MAVSEPVQAHAFPAAVEGAHFDLLRTLAASAFMKASPDATLVTWDGQSIAIPGRLYYSAAVIDRVVTEGGDRAVIAACLGSRCNDGYLRQRCFEFLVAHPRQWSSPYLVEAVGDYVLPIVQVLDGGLSDQVRAQLVDCILANESRFIRLARQAVSYWVFNRQRAPGGDYNQWSHYPGGAVVGALVTAARELEPTFGGELRNVLPRVRARNSRS